MNQGPSKAILTRAARLTAAFYAWEERGRGWRVWPFPVDLEPPFVAPAGLALSPPQTDDGRRPTRIGRWLERILGGGLDEAIEQHDEPGEPELEPTVTFDVVEFQLALPQDTKVSAEAVEHFLVSLSNCSEPVSFELVGTAEKVVALFSASDRDADQVRLQLTAHFPDAVVTERPLLLEEHWRTDTPSVVVDFGLFQEFMRPLRTFARFEVDPLSAVVGAMSGLAAGELAVFQVLFQSTKFPWSRSITQAVTSCDGQSFFDDDQSLKAQAEDKISRPLFSAVVRLAAQAGSESEAWDVARRIGGTLALFGVPDGNELVALSNEDYEGQEHQADLVRRRSRRSGMILNSAELASLAHPPSASVRSEKLLREEGRTRAVPRAVASSGLVLGSNSHAGIVRQVALTEEQRLRHTHVVGASGTGKSTLLLSMIVQDMVQGEGLALLDPHGDLIDEVLLRVPENRTGDVILVDPADVLKPVGFNILSAHSELEKTLLSSDLVAIFRRLSTSWGDQMTSVLGNAVLAFLESSQGGTLVNLRRFLVEAEFRSAFLRTVQDPEVVYYWQKEFPLLSGKPQAPLLTRLDAFLRPRLIRGMVSQKTSIDFAAAMDQGKILLVKLSQGAIGEENAALLGSLFLSKLHQLTLGRQHQLEQTRRPFHLYCDEFQHFITPSMATLLSGARKYRVGLVLAHQELRQLWNQDRDVAGAVLANAATRICFRVGDDDAKTLEGGFAHFTARDLQNLSRGQALVRIDRADQDFSLATEPLPPTTERDRERRTQVIAISRERHGGTAFIGASEGVASSLPLQEALPEIRIPRRSQPEIRPRTKQEVKADVKPDPTTSVLPGRGGPQHKYLQELIKRWAEANGWRVEVEKSILDGMGRVDVALERQGLHVACEICVSSTTAYELGNIRKCLSAGFDHVMSVAADKSIARRIGSAISKDNQLAMGTPVRVLLPDALFGELDDLTATATSESSTKGYRVTVRRSVTVGNPAQSTLARTIAGAMKRIRNSAK